MFLSPLPALRRSHLHFEQAAVEQAFGLFQLVQLLCCRRFVQIPPGQLRRVIFTLPSGILGFAPFAIDGNLAFLLVIL